MEWGARELQQGHPQSTGSCEQRAAGLCLQEKGKEALIQTEKREARGNRETMRKEGREPHLSPVSWSSGFTVGTNPRE